MLKTNEKTDKLWDTERRNNLLKYMEDIAKPVTDKMSEEEKQRFVQRIIDMGKPSQTK